MCSVNDLHFFRLSAGRMLCMQMHVIIALTEMRGEIDNSLASREHSMLEESPTGWSPL